METTADSTKVGSAQRHPVAVLGGEASSERDLCAAILTAAGK
jgi:hypothetical protein